MSVAVEELEKFSGKRVVLHVQQEDGTLAEIEGKVEAASAAGIAFKAKGKSNIDLVEPSQIEEIQAAPETPKKPTRKRRNLVEKGKAIQHLLDMHGVPLSWAKEATEEQAFEYHEGLDHSDLGHYHKAAKEKGSSEREQALSDEGDDE